MLNKNSNKNYEIKYNSTPNRRSLSKNKHNKQNEKVYYRNKTKNNLENTKNNIFPEKQEEDF